MVSRPIASPRATAFLIRTTLLGNATDEANLAMAVPDDRNYRLETDGTKVFLGAALGFSMYPY